MKHVILTFLMGLVAITAMAMQSQINVQPQLMVVINPGASSNAPAVGTNPNLSYEMLNNEAPVNSELTLLKAKENGELNSPITAGGMIQTNASASSNYSP